MAQIGAAKNHQQGSKAADRKTHGNSAHVPQNEKYHCAICNSSVVNKRDLIRQHEVSKKHKDAVAAAAVTATKRWRCETCGVDFPNTVEAVSSHMNSQDHQRMKMWDAEQNRDGPNIAANQRKVNGAEGGAAKQQRNEQ